MNTEFWLEIWEKNKIGFHQQEINSHLKSYWQHLNVTPNCRVFVPLCGKTRDILWLCGQGHSVLGVEISLLFKKDVLDEYPQFQAQGLNRLQEKIYLLKPR